MALLKFMKGEKLIGALKKKLRVSKDTNLVRHLGISTPGIQHWKKRKSVTEKQVANLINSAYKQSAKHSQANAIRPIVEFFPIKKSLSSHNKKFELFSIKTKDGKEHPHLSGLRKELEKYRGIYVFFDSRGRAIYVGKTEKQKLWKEIKDAFNRSRGDFQKIRRVKQPNRKQMYRNSNEKARQIIEELIPLHDLAAYFSAYHVADSMIEDVEALLVRCAANDLLNKRMERFSRQRHN